MSWYFQLRDHSRSYFTSGFPGFCLGIQVLLFLTLGNSQTYFISEHSRFSALVAMAFVLSGFRFVLNYYVSDFSRVYVRGAGSCFSGLRFCSQNYYVSDFPRVCTGCRVLSFLDFRQAHAGLTAVFRRVTSDSWRRWGRQLVSNISFRFSGFMRAWRRFFDEWRDVRCYGQGANG